MKIKWIAAMPVLAAGMLMASAAGDAVPLDISACAIVKPSGGKVPKVVEYAVEELRSHLQLIVGMDIPVGTGTAPSGMFPIYVGIRPADDGAVFLPEEARWRIAADGVWLYGEDKDASGATAQEVALNNDSRPGTLFAVYEFLEKQAGVTWIEPGAAGISYASKTALTLEIGNGAWSPKLIQRKIRLAYKSDMRDMARADGNIPDGMQFADEEYAGRQLDEQIWMRRMRMGSSVHLSYGHAFTQWWARYGATHPEYFALNKNGQRRPVSASAADRIKLCVSNPDVARQVAHDHFFRDDGTLKNIKDVGYNVNAIENDSRNYCRCENCQALDVVLPGEENLDIDDRVLSDRYVYFANAVLTEARKIFDEHYAQETGESSGKVRVLFYAYSRYNFPPRREILKDGVFLFLIPNLAVPLAELDQYYLDWKNMGANAAFLRPNDLCQDTGMPVGFESHMFEKYRLGNQHLALLGTDYDTCWGFWPTTGIANYIMARAMYRPDRPMSDWDNEYFATYGAVSGDIRDYYTYWRQIWNDRIMKNVEKIHAMGAPLDLFRQKVTQLTDQLYSENDYDITDAILSRALARPPPDTRQRARIQSLQLANQHNRLSYRAVIANRLASASGVTEQRMAAQNLLDFRVAHRLDLNIHWELLCYLNDTYQDNAGLMRLLGTEAPGQKTERLRLEPLVAASRQVTSLAARPVIASFSPVAVAPGGTVTIEGANFYDMAGVLVGDEPAAWHRESAERLTVTIPANVPETGHVTIITQSGVSVGSSTRFAREAPVSGLRQLSNQIVVNGHDLVLTASAAGVPAAEYAWQVLTTDAGATWQAIGDGGIYNGATTDTLRISGVEAGMSGWRYRFVATNGVGSPVNSNAAVLRVEDDNRYPRPVALAADAAGNLYIADDSLSTVQLLAVSGTLSTFAGLPGATGMVNGTGTAARFDRLAGLAVTPDRRLVVADANAHVIRILSSGAVAATLAGSAYTPGAVDGTGAAARFNGPEAVAADAAGNIYVADTQNNAIRMINASGSVSTIAGAPDGSAGGADGIGIAARFRLPAGIAVAGSGTIYVADTGNHTLRAIAPGTFVVRTLAGMAGGEGFADGNATAQARFRSPRGIEVDGGYLYIADTGNSLVRELNLATGDVLTIAGRPGPGPTHGMQAGAGTDSIFDHPRGLALDMSGNIFVADTGNAVIRRIAPDDSVTTLLPTPFASQSGGGGQGNDGNNNNGGGSGGGATAPWYFAATAALIALRALWFNPKTVKTIRSADYMK
ncbi:DUF4838 domain-containing protein [Termitidicoccus mucosus]|uniref:IPT/TIG domain-containing protein n=1 Tax=Termitidicoccus mucosus TaxID=1184151 RepID=A0A178IDV9_9BACT|nr:hypothetical protein AW736_18510 [Opitutaceae bacterium TSB47]